MRTPLMHAEGDNSAQRLNHAGALTSRRPVLGIGIRFQLICAPTTTAMERLWKLVRLGRIYWQIFLQAKQVAPAARVSMLRPISQKGSG